MDRVALIVLFVGSSDEKSILCSAGLCERRNANKGGEPRLAALVV